MPRSFTIDISTHLISCFTGQWSFRRIGTMGMLASQAEIVWLQAPGALLFRYHPPPIRKNFEMYMRNPAISCIFGRKNSSFPVYNAFLYTLTMGTLLPCIPVTFRQWE